MACGGNSSKVEFCERFVVNLILILFGCVGLFLIVCGAVGMTQYSYLSEIVNKQAFGLMIGAGVFILLNCFVGWLGTKWVLAEDSANHAKGKVLLFIFSFILLFFIVFEAAVAIAFLAYAGTIESVETGNEVVDNVVSEFNEKIDRIVNCTFNYCCQQQSLRRSVKFTIYNKDGSIARNTGGITNDPYGRSEAYAYYLGNLFVPAEKEEAWRKTPETAADTDARTTFVEQYYDGMDDYERIVGADMDPNLDKAKTLEWLTRCGEWSQDLGQDCWVQWKTQCPDPLDSITIAGWNQICSFVGDTEKWQKPTDGVAVGQEERTPMLDTEMCNARYGQGVWQEDTGFMSAVLWKIQKARPLAIIVIVLGVVQMMLLITACMLLCHRAHTHVSQVTAVDAKPKNVEARVEEGKSQKDEGTEDDNDL